MSRFESAGDSLWRAWGCGEELGSKPRSQDVVLDCQNHLQQTKRERSRASVVVQLWPILVRAGTRRTSYSAGEEGPSWSLDAEGLSGKRLDTSREARTG